MARIDFLLGDAGGSGLHGSGRIPDRAVSKVVCLVHGLGEHSGRYDWLMSRLEDSGYGVMAFDQRGHGRSPGRRGDAPSCDALLSDIDLLLEEAASVFPDIPRYLYGHSFGGSLVIGYALSRASACGVVVTSPLLIPTKPPPAWKRTAARIMSRMIPTLHMSTGIDSSALSRREGVTAEYDSDPLVHGLVTARLGNDILAFGRKNLESAPKLRIPMLIMHGGTDSITSPDASRAFAREAGEICQLRIWPGLYHELHSEPEREQVLAYTLEWLENDRRTSGAE